MHPSRATLKPLLNQGNRRSRERIGKNKTFHQGQFGTALRRRTSGKWRFAHDFSIRVFLRMRGANDPKGVFASRIGWIALK